jgi:hypothetical protein
MMGVNSYSRFQALIFTWFTKYNPKLATLSYSELDENSARIYS